MALLLLLAGVLAKFHGWTLLAGEAALHGSDFRVIHLHRIEFAKEFFPAAWYPSELLGTPFWANLQNFPWNPLRLPLLFLDPHAGYGVGVVLIATLSAWFTYLYSRQIGLRFGGALLAGWSFIGSGYFVSRIYAGHLPLLEAYLALPLFLWLVEKWIALPEKSPVLHFRLLGLAMAMGVLAFTLSGHPQLPFYAVAATLLYLIGRAPTRRGLALVPVIGLGATLGLVIWWPMLLLIGRSTRILDLDRAANDVPLYPQLAADFFFPLISWIFRGSVTLHEWVAHLPNAALWDSSAYTGLLAVPALVLVVAALAFGHLPKTIRRPFAILLVLGALAFLGALPFVVDALGAGGFTILRSPVRQIYLTIFLLSVGFGVAFDLLWQWRPRQAALLPATAALLMATVQIIDLQQASRPFLRTFVPVAWETTAFDQWMLTHATSDRAAVDLAVPFWSNRRIDDVGFFDSIMLASTYRAVMAMAGESPRANIQHFDGSRLPLPALQFLGAGTVVSIEPYPDEALKPLNEGPPYLYKLESTAPRAAFYETDAIRFLGEESNLTRLRNLNDQSWWEVTLDLEQKPDFKITGHTELQPPEAIPFVRQHPDRIELEISNENRGIVRVLESYDPGWRAWVNNEEVPILLADGFAMAVAVEPGRNEIRFVYRTPGFRTGLLLSLFSGLLLAGYLGWFLPRYLPCLSFLKTAAQD